MKKEVCLFKNSLILFDMLWQVLPLSVVKVLKYIVKVSIGHQSQVANSHLEWAQMSNETSHWSFRPRLNGPPWSQMANKS